MIAKSIGDKIAAARKKNRLSQAELAKHVSISPQAVGKWERGESLPDITTLHRLAEILGVDLNHFSESFPSVTVEATESHTPAAVSAEHPAPLAENPVKPLKWNLSQGQWVDTDFSGLENLEGKLRASNLKNCKFVATDLAGLSLSSNEITGCDFRGANLSESSIQSCELANNLFPECSFRGARISSCDIRGCDFSEANLSEAVFATSELNNIQLRNAVLKSTLFKLSQLSNLVWESDLDGCVFEHCAFTRVVFKNSMITNTFFRCRRMKSVRFEDCKADLLSYEALKSTGADLTGLSIMTAV